MLGRNNKLIGWGVALFLGFTCLGLKSEIYTIGTTANFSQSTHTYKFEIGDEVGCSKWPNGSFWKGRVIERKDGLYKVKISKVNVKGFMVLYLNANACTGNRRLSYEDGVEYKNSEIWVLEACLD